MADRGPASGGACNNAICVSVFASSTLGSSPALAPTSCTVEGVTLIRTAADIDLGGALSCFCAGRFDLLDKEYLCDDNCFVTVGSNLSVGAREAFSTSTGTGWMSPAPLPQSDRLSYEFLMAIRLSLSETPFSRQPCCWRRFGCRPLVLAVEQAEPVIVKK